MMTQQIRAAMVAILTNHPKAREELLPKLRYTKNKKRLETATAIYGAPNRFTLRKIEGACFSSASPYRTREARNTTAMPQLKADVRIAALTMDGRTVIPAFSNAITNGLSCAVPVELPSEESL
jgi:hypothetical protein